MVVIAAIPWLRGLWNYYREYTSTPIHTAATAALAIFGILIFVDPLFAVVAIGSYVLPPIVLYVRQPANDDRSSTARPDAGDDTPRDGDTDTDRDDGDTDSDSDRDG
ncbi:hypothetical protein [Natronobeatus ordinarius]|uniref:hypothetical protein n=1 Tax=Natronobeatus ordinarius TaxID=2963433 RepID=UPI0031F32E29